MIGKGDLELVLSGLILLPAFFTHFLLKSEALVSGLELLQGLLPFLRVFVLQQASHARDCFGLISVSLFFAFLLVRSLLLFPNLLIGPVPLVLSINHHALVVH